MNLTIGESIQVGWHYLHPDDPATYRKDVIYLDVLTDRGTFRFDKEGNLLGFDPPKPPTLEEQVFADGEQRWQEAKRAASTKLPKRAAQYLREQKREIVTALSKKYGLTEDQVRAIVLP